MAHPSALLSELLQLQAQGLFPTPSPVSGAGKLDPTAWPMTLPALMGSPPTVSRGAAGAATQISGSLLTAPDKAGAFLYLGGPKKRVPLNPGYYAYDVGSYPQITSTTPSAVEFRIKNTDSTGRFEIYYKGTGTGYRLLLRRPGENTWGTVTTGATATPGDGNLYLELVTLGAAGTWEVRIELFFGTFLGVRASPTSTIRATRKPTKRIIVVGDSFTEPTISDSGTPWVHNGYVQQFAYLTGYDIWSAGSGGTGWVATNGARPKLRGRLAADILAFDADEYWFAMGINDLGQDVATVSAEVAVCLAMAKAARPNARFRVFSPWWKGDHRTFLPQLLQLRDAIKTPALAAGAIWHDALDLGAPDWATDAATYSTTLTATAGPSDTSITIGALPAFWAGSAATAPAADLMFVIGSGAAQYVRKASGWMDGSTGAFIVPIDAVLGATLPVGTPVRLCGPCYLTGTGSMAGGAGPGPKGDGDADLNVGPDGTHPPTLGHVQQAYTVAAVVSATP